VPTLDLGLQVRPELIIVNAEREGQPLETVTP
jgi:hypothetical protein